MRPVTVPWRRLPALTVLSLAFLAGCASTYPAVEPSGGVSTTAEPTVPAVALNPDVRQGTIQKTICVPGYTASVRPATSYTNGVKRKLLREGGIAQGSMADYELDHRVPLALGGHPRNLANLALQPWTGENGAKRKDILERRLQALVCANKVGLQAAQSAIYVNWQAAYRRYVGD
jgi:hypothetical protein